MSNSSGITVRRFEFKRGNSNKFWEVTVRANGFQEQALPVNAATSDRFKDLVFRLQREGGRK